METLQGILAEHPFFAGMPDQHMELITGCASNIRLEPGQMIFREGENAHEFYLIRQGKVALQMLSERRGPLTILTVGEG
jgi:CRP-like cAMP-binding protein